jgi:cytochrome c oxidase assembly factor CtaG
MWEKILGKIFFVCLTMQRKTRLILALLLPLQYFGLLVLRHYPQLIETYYSQGIYPLMSSLSRYLFGWIPFSVGDLGYILILLGSEQNLLPL